jgi:hypothetical protein
MFESVSRFLRQIFPPVVATLIAALLIAGFNRAFSTHLTQPRLGGLKSEASAPPVREQIMPEVVAVVPSLIEEAAPVREWEKGQEREAAKDHGPTKVAEVAPAAQPEPPAGLAAARAALRKMEPRPVETRQVEPRPVEQRPSEPRRVEVIVTPPPVVQAPPPVITAEPVVTVPDRPSRRPIEDPAADEPPPRPQGPIGTLVDTLKPSSLFARARELGEKIEAAGNDMLPTIRQ